MCERSQHDALNDRNVKYQIEEQTRTRRRRRKKDGEEGKGQR